MGKTIPFPSPQLAGAGFVLRPFAARDYDAANAAREDEDTALWVNALPQPDGDAMSRFDDELRRDGKLLHLAIEADDGSAYLGPFGRWWARRCSPSSAPPAGSAPGPS